VGSCAQANQQFTVLQLQKKKKEARKGADGEKTNIFSRRKKSRVEKVKMNNEEILNISWC
jgi:hypothetical protein